MKREVIVADNAPKAIGSYSQGISCDAKEMIFLSGQIPLDPVTMQVNGEDVGTQTQQVMRNIEAVLSSKGLGFEAIVKTTIFLKDMNDFSVVNEIYGRYFPNQPPARSTIEVSRLPKDVKIEIECIAAC